MGQSSVLRAFVLGGALASASAANAIDFTLISIGQAPSAICTNNVINNVNGVAVSYNLPDNGDNVPNIRFSWTVTPNAGPVIHQTASFWFDPESAVQMDVQDWFDDEFGGSVPVPGNPAPPWTATIIGSPINAFGVVVGSSARYTFQCDGTNASVVDVVSGIVPATATPVPANAPGALVVLVLACLAWGMRLAAKRGRA